MCVPTLRRVAVSIAVVMLAPGPQPVARGADPVAGQLAPPVQMSPEDDRRRMMDLLHIASLPPGASGSSPATYDEATANPFPVLPDALRMKSGRTVTTAAQWRRRPVHTLLRKKDLGTNESPPIDTALIDGDIGFRQHTGGHTPEPTWPTFLTFASRYLAPRAGGTAK